MALPQLRKYTISVLHSGLVEVCQDICHEDIFCPSSFALWLTILRSTATYAITKVQRSMAFLMVQAWTLLQITVLGDLTAPRRYLTTHTPTEP